MPLFYKDPTFFYFWENYKDPIECEVYKTYIINFVIS